MYVFLNQHIVPGDSPLIQANDRGLLLGDGLFETLKAVNGKPLHFSQHFSRLHHSAQFLAIPLLHDHDALFTICQQVLQANQLDKNIAAMRITLTRGNSARGIDLPRECHPALLVTAAAYQSPGVYYPRAFITSLRRNEYSPFSQHKTLGYLEFIQARKIARDNGYDEGILLNTRGAITESAIANIFFVINNEVVTAPLTAGVLPGITRQQVLACCQAHKIPLQERAIFPEEITDVTEAFQTNSLIGIQIFCSINKHALRYGAEAVVTQRIVEKLACQPFAG